MKHKLGLRLAVTMGLLGALAACPAPAPGPNVDLVPVTAGNLAPPQNGTAFCDTAGNETLRIHIRNIGRDDAPKSQALVTFFLTGPNVTESVLIDFQPGEFFVHRDVPIPPGCFNSDCDFKITADSSMIVDETNELNNSVTDNCIG